jgi:hypothetical protein
MKTLQVRLGHFTHESDQYDTGTRYGWKESYLTFPLNLSQPEKGKSVSEIQCPQCGETVSVSVASPGSVQLRKSIELAFGIGILLFGAYTFLTTERGEISGAQALMVGFSCLGVFWGIFALASYYAGDFGKTVRVSDPKKLHTIFEGSR